MKALVDKCGDLLNMKTYLPGLPTTHLSATFFDDFRSYVHREEWRSFMRKQVSASWGRGTAPRMRAGTGGGNVYRGRFDIITIIVILLQCCRVYIFGGAKNCPGDVSAHTVVVISYH